MKATPHISRPEPLEFGAKRVSRAHESHVIVDGACRFCGLRESWGAIEKACKRRTIVEHANRVNRKRSGTR